MIPEFWSRDKETMLRKCVEMGLSGAAAAVVLKCSRNAAIAKAFRLGIPFHGKAEPPRRAEATAEQIAAVNEATQL